MLKIFDKEKLQSKNETLEIKLKAVEQACDNYCGLKASYEWAISECYSNGILSMEQRDSLYQEAKNFYYLWEHI